MQKIRRGLIDNYILKDPIADLNVQDLRRGNILDFRQRLLNKTTDQQANRVLGVLKTCIKEGVYREELERDPTIGIGNIWHHPMERGVFMRKELKELFPADGLGPWKDLQVYTCFMVAATMGLRRGEVLALRWRDVDFDKGWFSFCQAWKDDTNLGPPKWGRSGRTYRFQT